MDVSPLAQTRAGTARYINGLLRELDGRDEVDVRQLSLGGSARPWNLPRDALWYPFMLSRAARDLDVLHCPTYRGPIVGRAPLVVTVHDLAVLRHPDAFNRWSRWYGPRVVPRVVRAARIVIAVSEFTKRELIELLDVPAEKIRVIPNAVEDAFTRNGPAAEGEYVLAVGTLEPRKNLVRVVDAARSLDDELAELYRGARCVAYPSLYEGFGIPVLEAMACGTPVVTSRGGATEELADGAAVLVDPLDPAAIAAGIERAASQRDELVARGLRRAQAFSWKSIADMTVGVYNELVA